MNESVEGGEKVSSAKVAQDIKLGRGFAAMAVADRRRIASKGGQSVPPEKRNFSLRPELAVAAGRKGGQNVPREKRFFSQNREAARDAGRKGGENGRGARKGNKASLP